MQIDRKGGTGFLSVSDEDLWLIGINPLFVTDEEFQRIVDGLMDHYNDNFTEVLADIVRQVKGDDSHD